MGEGVTRCGHCGEPFSPRRPAGVLALRCGEVVAWRDDAPDIDAPSAGWGCAVALSGAEAARRLTSAGRWAARLAEWSREGRRDLVDAFAGSAEDAAREAEGAAVHAGLVRDGLVPFDPLAPGGEAT